MPDPTRDLEGFDIEFDDTEWTDGWLHVPIAQIPPGKHPGGYRVERHMLHYAEVFGQHYRLAAPLWCRLLFDPAGKLWMSDTPQERIMMHNNGRRSRGHTLVGGLGLGLYPQYAVAGAAGQATSFTIIERSSVVRDIVEPTLRVALEARLEVKTGDVAAYLHGPVTTLFDTIFLDIWDRLDAAHLPMINRLRDQALHHLAPGGRALLWGYRWMTRLFEEACRQLLTVAPGQRREWLAKQSPMASPAVALLSPVMDRFEGQMVENVENALTWCRQHIVRRVEPV